MAKFISPTTQNSILGDAHTEPAGCLSIMAQKWTNYPLRASEPETISMISLVMAAWRALL